MLRLTQLLVLSILSTTIAFGKTIYVKANANGTNAGNSWANAYISLQTALSNASNGDQIWIAAGTYTPGNKSTDYFNMKNGVSIYGGFSGTETKLEERNTFNNKCIISGEIGTIDETDNCKKLLRFNKLSTPIVVNGLTFSGGYTSDFIGTIEIASSSPIFSQCIFENNKNVGGFASGGAITITGFDGESKPQFINCIFRNNYSAVMGGAVHSNDNNANQTIFANCLFDGNQATRGAAIHNGSGVVATFNCTFVNNVAQKGSASYSASGTLTQHINGIIWNDDTNPVQTTTSSVQVVINYSIIKGGYTGTNNINKDPQFLGSTNYGIKATSPAKDAGSPAVDPADLPAIDLAGNSRVTFGKLDLGAYEFACSVVGQTITETTCDSYTSPSGKTYAETGAYSETFKTKDGCDSVVHLNLTITKAESSISETSCSPITINGKTYNKSGTYTQNLKTKKGCDSILSIEITIPVVNTNVTRTGNTLTSTANNATYQWVDCDNANSPINGETGKIFTATTDGNYAVEVTQNNCTKLSKCTNLTPSFINSINTTDLSIYPNPANELLLVEWQNIKQVEFIIFSANGVELMHGLLQKGQNSVEIDTLEQGVFYLKANNTIGRFIKI
ncbi:MAG: hypothetical protein KDC92_10200 [Bacteroidetes bacterium]|nr:hypothetical protein [Bacteroidota bacterium]